MSTYSRIYRWFIVAPVYIYIVEPVDLVQPIIYNIFPLRGGLLPNHIKLYIDRDDVCFPHLIQSRRSFFLRYCQSYISLFLGSKVMKAPNKLEVQLDSSWSHTALTYLSGFLSGVHSVLKGNMEKIVPWWKCKGEALHYYSHLVFRSRVGLHVRDETTHELFGRMGMGNGHSRGKDRSQRKGSGSNWIR